MIFTRPKHPFARISDLRFLFANLVLSLVSREYTFTDFWSTHSEYPVPLNFSYDRSLIFDACTFFFPTTTAKPTARDFGIRFEQFFDEKRSQSVRLLFDEIFTRKSSAKTTNHETVIVVEVSVLNASNESGNSRHE